MKNLKTILAAGGLAVSLAFVSSFSQQPVETGAFALLGHSLGLGQRDFRVFNNFTDASANNNNVPDANFPGSAGAVMAIWKAHAEWGSEVWAGNGLGDPTQAVLGDSGANFDNTFQGEASGTGTFSQNIHSELNGSNGGVLAFMQGGSNGWWIRYYSTWAWRDGPGNVTSGVDLQGVACHESGHAVGLNHSNVSGATMLPSISGTGVGQRSINNDDRAGLQAVYGVKASGKPRITALLGSSQIGQTLTIVGNNFSTSDNDVWFNAVNSNGTPAKVTGVAASGGGTQISVTIPSGVEDGEVLVRSFDGSGAAFLSNAWPIDIGGSSGDPPVLASVSPTVGPAGGWTEVVISGSGFTGTTSVTFGGVPANSFNVDSPTQITAVSPGGALAQAVDVTVTDDDGAGTLPNAFIYTFNPVINIDTVTPNTGPDSGGTSVTITGGSLVGATAATFGGAPGSNFVVTSATSATVDTPAGTAGAADVTVTGDSADTIVGGFIYQGGPAGDFVNVGPGIPGVLGAPLLTGTGDLTPGSLAGYSTTISNAIPNNLGFLFLSLSQNTAPLKGGTLYTFPIDVQLQVPVDGSGQLTLPHAIPAGQGFEGLSITVQWWFADGTAVQGASASNGLRLDIP